MKKKISIIVGAIVVCGLFAYISYLTPLAGDDWGYAVNGLKGNPFVTAFEFYFSWSGRFFSELWGFIVAPNKWLWNILNPLIVTSIFVLMMKIIDIKRNSIVIVSSVIFLILSIKDQVRMETYTWIMGTGNYMVPLLLLLIVLYMYKKLLIDCKISTIYYIVISLCSFVACLMMESVAGTLLILNSIVLTYFFLCKRKKYKPYLMITLVTIIGFMILRLSPGAASRALGEHQAWFNLNLIEQIATNWPNLIKYTLLDNKYLVLFLNASLLVYVGFNLYPRHKNKVELGILSAVFIVGAFQSLSAYLYSVVQWEWLQLFFDYSYLFAALMLSALFVVMIIAIVYVLMSFEDGMDRLKSVTIFIVAALTNGAMMISPIFASRNSLFTIFLLMIVVGIVINELHLCSKVKLATIVVLLVLNAFFVKTYITKYRLVASVDKERMAQIEYYKDHPEIKEAWITRMPIMSIHSADVEEWDTNHMDSFRAYYGLSPKVKVIFAFKEKY